jgi:putative NADPH-quinone reductase
MEQESVPADLEAQEGIRWADHLVLVYPLWLGTMPALLQAFLEQVLRPGFAVAHVTNFDRGLLQSKSARIVVTMGMPAMLFGFSSRPKPDGAKSQRPVLRVYIRSPR